MSPQPTPGSTPDPRYDPFFVKAKDATQDAVDSLLRPASNGLDDTLGSFTPEPPRRRRPRR